MELSDLELQVAEIKEFCTQVDAVLEEFSEQLSLLESTVDTLTARINQMAPVPQDEVAREMRHIADTLDQIFEVLARR